MFKDSIRVSSVALTSNASGVASENIQKVIGKILGVYVDLGTGMTTADVTVTTDMGDVILNGVTVTADTLYPIRDTAVDNADSTYSTSETNAIINYLNKGGNITVAVASATASKTMNVHVIYE